MPAWTARIALVTTTLLASSSSWAGAWNHAPGHGYTKAGLASFVSDTACDEDGVCTPRDPFRLMAQTAFFYGELGLARRLTATALVPYVVATNQSTHGVSFHTASTGDATFGAQLAWLDDTPLVVATRVELKLPLYRGGPSESGLQTERIPGFPRSTTSFPAVGDGQVDVTALLAVGGALPIVDGFFNAEAGYRVRSAGITDALVGQGSVGVFILRRRLLIQGNAARILAIPPGPGSEELPGKGYWSAGPSCAVRVVRGLSLELGADFIFRGENAATGQQVTFGVSYGW